ncbi:transmembrane nine 1 [Planoprotostelium fungivorum]|uniref:Transmembrane 9 superfamily member n=1 Tax=Planoprotostelium fungivorum TaxID=1890364 RepID=A0A2P6N5H5_9EUKA|nr:transmembrane nine 1 [Planoprotostelium fungivorum]
MRQTLLVVLLFLALLSACLADNHYQEKDDVVLWVDKVGPFDNPQETYEYFSLPFCSPEKKIERKENLGEALQGYELRGSPIKIQYKVDVPTKSICGPRTLSKKDVERFDYAIRRSYWYQMFLDDLPIWGMVGEIAGEAQKGRGASKSKDLSLFTYQNITIYYNRDQIIEVHLRSGDLVKIPNPSAELDVDFTYSIKWIATDESYLHRFDKYLEHNFFEHKIHWFSIFNSFMMVIFLVGLVAMILTRTLRNDYARYAKDDDMEEGQDLGEESGWKQVHGDVFRPPHHLVFFSALVGTGHQLSILVFVVVFGSAVGTTLHLYELYAIRGTSVTIFVVLYALSSFVGGYGGGGFYSRNEGKHWIKVMVLTAGLFPGTCCMVGSVLNVIAVSYGSLSTVPFGTMFAMFSLWLFLVVPLTLLGTIVGRNWNGKPNNPCRINPVPRQIPEKRWYLSPSAVVLLGGLLPFGSIFIENYFVFTSFWHYKYYYVYGFMLLVYIMLIVMTICVTIVSTYFLLNSEDYRWHWSSFLSSASTAFYVFLYSIYYFFYRTKMTGLLQITFYFGYTFMFCLGLGILCGSIGFIGTSVFVKHIYQRHEAVKTFFSSTYRRRDVLVVHLQFTVPLKKQPILVGVHPKYVCVITEINL